MATSAQYYLNPKGISAEQGCQWGDGSQPIGNWAPLNMGAGFKGGQTWLSIFPNTPTTNAKLDYNVKITGDVSQTCKYEDGVFYDSSGESATGCTVCSLLSALRSVSLTCNPGCRSRGQERHHCLLLDWIWYIVKLRLQSPI
jgi:hypothetical protein